MQANNPHREIIIFCRNNFTRVGPSLSFKGMLRDLVGFAIKKQLIGGSNLPPRLINIMMSFSGNDFDEYLEYNSCSDFEIQQIRDFFIGFILIRDNFKKIFKFDSQNNQIKVKLVRKLFKQIIRNRTC